MLQFLAIVVLTILASALAVAVIGAILAALGWVIQAPLNIGVWLDHNGASQRPTKPIVLFSRATWSWLVPAWRQRARRRVR